MSCMAAQAYHSTCHSKHSHVVHDSAGGRRARHTLPWPYLLWLCSMAILTMAGGRRAGGGEVGQEARAAPRAEQPGDATRCPPPPPR
eukprot:scaffold122748_cov24-Phaeocystis_antarctica.AAC.1